ncbi:conserved hypothetical protein (DUF885) [Formosa agariphila KMM 3901]|uniref:Lipoprotein n=1 Tax=Formosa agariphila (strain DSM 15362 / KCTC 12365 / LMG 23005 / KMM 3901 / M-2Alg 35-1) TaxID=1347342 RepID=T2KKX1_FORAG|nr:DUF885 domain-containing protein [Formosa agariphila]CDF79375.1 conserved hypothetical protein (DUF885) [Formosa agariphila KMM 3901]
MKTCNITKIALPVLFFLLVFASCKEEPKAVVSQKAELNAWFDVKYEELLQMSPMHLTSLGRKDLNDKIDDMSKEAEDRKLAWYAESAKTLKETFDYDNLDEADQASYDLWMYQYEMLKEGMTYRDMEYVFEQMRGAHTYFPNFLINYHKVDSLPDMTAYISRIKGVGVAMNQLLIKAQDQADLGILPPKFAFETVISQTKGLLDGKTVLEDMHRKTDALLASEQITSEEAESLKQESASVIQEAFIPAYQNLLTWLESEIENAEATPTGVSRHENGKDFYNYQLKVFTTSNLTADQVHEKGLEEVARIREEMLAIKDKVGFDGDLNAFFKFVDSDPQFYFPNTDEGRQGYLDESTKYLDAIEKKLPDYFGILPKAKLEVKRVEAFREQDGAPQHYNAGTPDGSRPGTYYVHLSDMSMMDKTTMEGVAYHEGLPGHHMQISIAQELEGVPQFRTQAGFSVYSEGWALYSEILAKEMGGYQNPYYDFGRLVNEIWRAIRLVVDTGLHAKGWTEADAFKYFKENSSVSDGAITAEVQRYMVMPGQATSYKIGMLKIQELRKTAEDKLGDKFDIKGFHDTLLGGGALPMELLERRVNMWIDSQMKN